MRPLLRFAAQTALVAAAAVTVAALAASARRRGSVADALPRLPGSGGKDQRPAAVSDEAADEMMASGPSHVRPAGPGATRDPHRRWDEVDEASDESFPASDPPASY